MSGEEDLLESWPYPSCSMSRSQVRRINLFQIPRRACSSAVRDMRSYSHLPPPRLPGTLFGKSTGEPVRALHKHGLIEEVEISKTSKLMRVGER